MHSSMRSIGCLLLTGAVYLWNASPAFPWGSKGHEIVLLSSRFTSLTLLVNGQRTPSPRHNVADASTWPDKAGRQVPNMNPYHFINFKKDSNTYDQQRDGKLRNCIIEAIAW
jgi:hypothetical protein